MGWPSLWVTGCLTEAALVGLRSLSFPSVSNPGRSHVGRPESGLAKPLSLVCATSEAVVDLNLTTSGYIMLPLHRAMAEELADVRGGLPEASSKSDHDLAIHRNLEEKGLKRYKNKGSLDYWMSHQPATGRPLSAVLCCQSDPAAIHPGVLS